MLLWNVYFFIGNWEVLAGLEFTMQMTLNLGRFSCFTSVHHHVQYHLSVETGSHWSLIFPQTHYKAPKFPEWHDYRYKLPSQLKSITFIFSDFFKNHYRLSQHDCSMGKGASWANLTTWVQSLGPTLQEKHYCQSYPLTSALIHTCLNKEV